MNTLTLHMQMFMLYTGNQAEYGTHIRVDTSQEYGVPIQHVGLSESCVVRPCVVRPVP